MLWLLASCDPDPTTEPTEPVVPVSFTAPPALSANPTAGLTAWLDLSLSAPRALRVTVSNPDRTWTVDAPVGADHHLLLTGFRPEVDHPIRIDAVDELGRVAGTAELTHRGEALPADFFTWETRASSPAEMEPGVTLLGLGNYLVAVDPQGLPVWFVPIQGSIHEANRLSTGELVVVVNRQLVTVFGVSGEPHQMYRPARNFDDPVGSIAVDVEALHHDLIELPNGNLVGLSIERRWLDYPVSEADAGAGMAPVWVAGDVVVEFDRAGNLVRELPLLDRLEPQRIGYDSVDGNYWEDFEPWSGDEVKDWSHGNALSYDPVSDTLLVGLRHQDAVVGLAFATGEVAWVVAPTETWPPRMADVVLAPDTPGFEYAYHMHGAKFTASDPSTGLLRIALFDNGNYRASPFAPQVPQEENYSRALELELDPAAGVYRPVWSWGEDLDPPHFSGSVGDVDVLPTTDHVLVTFGNVADPTLGGVRVVELTRDHQIVWDLVVPFPTATTFRSQRLAGLIQGL
ncbi:MAG: aryl-sulfate sulfotransferase [Myxococcota bacterium]